MELKIEYIAVEDLKPYEKNTRKHEKKDVDNIAKSIEKYGMCDAIGIWKDNIIVEGHGRLMAAKELGIKRLPCIRLDDMTDTQRRLYAIEHNRTAELSKWLPDELNREIEALKLEGVEMPELDLDDIGGDIEEMPEIQDDDFDVTMPEETTAQRGQIWQLGRHRLMCGDSSSADDVARLMDGATADLLLTDPPYNVDVGSCERPYSSNNGVSIENDSMPDDQFIAFLAQCLRNANKFLRGGCGLVYFLRGLETCFV
jgi:site-specific DNA-methyltransferase (adenine-specific)